MPGIVAPSKNQKNQIGGAGIGSIGTVQQAATAGIAFDLTEWKGREINIAVSAEARIRWSATTSTTIATANNVTAATPTADGGGRVYPGMPNYRDVPTLPNKAANEGIFLVVVPLTGTVDVGIECVG